MARRTMSCAGGIRALVALCGLGLSAASGQTTFQTLSVSPADEWGTSLERQGLGYVIAGNTTVGAQTGVIVRRTDQFGNAIGQAWTYTRPNGDLTAQSVRVARDRSIMVAGEVTPLGDNTHGIFLMKLNPITGAVVWFRVYWGTPFTGQGGTVVRELQGPAGGFVLVGRKIVPGTNQLGGILITTDANGVQTCGTIYTLPGAASPQWVSFNDVRQNPDNSFTISGFTRVNPQTARLPLVLRTRCNAAPTWSRNYLGGSVSGDLWGEGLDLALSNPQIAPDLTVVTGPWRNVNGQSVGSHQLVVNGVTGAPLSMSGYPTFLEAQSIRVTPGLRSLLAGKYATGPQQPAALVNGALMRLAVPSGNVIALRELNNLATPNGREVVEEAIRTPDGGAAGTGDAQQYPFTATRELLHVKTNAALSSPVECDSPRQLQRVSDELTLTRQLSFAPIPPDLIANPVFQPRQMEQPDTCAEIRGCTPAPAGLSLWLPLDDVGVGATNVVAPAFSGTHVNGPAFTGGSYVLNSRFYDGFDDYTQVPSYAGVEPGALSFSMDAWVRSTGNTAQVIINKFRQIGPAQFKGYSLYVQGGTLQVALGAGAAPVVLNSGLAVPLNQWNFVAFVYNASANTGTFYVNNSTVTLAAAAAAGDKNTGALAPFRVGASQGVPTSLFRGNIDEVEFFRGSALTAAQVAAIRDAGVSGKCKDACRDGTGAFCSPTQTTTAVTLWVCNYGTVPTSYAWQPQGLGVGIGCSVQGPTTFAPNGGIVGPVNPGQCAPVTITVTRPTGLAGAGLAGCFQVEFTNLTTNNIFTCNGKVVDGGPLCVSSPVGDSELKVVTGQLTNTGFLLANSAAQARTLDVVVRVERFSDEDQDAGGRSPISLNGLPPGQPVIRTITIPANGSRQLPLFLSSDFSDVSGPASILMEADLDGDGESEPISRIAVLAVDDAECDSIDFNNDGSSFDPQDIEALLSVYGEGPCVPETATCNDIDVNNDGSVFDPCDIASFLTLYGEGPCTPCGQ